jgi:hypothetical protein
MTKRLFKRKSCFFLLLVRPGKAEVFWIEKKIRWTFVGSYDLGNPQTLLLLKEKIGRHPSRVILDLPDIKVSLEAHPSLGKEKGFLHPWVPSYISPKREQEILREAWGEEALGRVFPLKRPLFKKTHLLVGITNPGGLEEWKKGAEFLAYAPLSTSVLSNFWVEMAAAMRGAFQEGEGGDGGGSLWHLGILCGKSGYGYLWLIGKNQLVLSRTFSIPQSLIPNPSEHFKSFLEELIQSTLVYAQRNFSLQDSEIILVSDFLEGEAGSHTVESLHLSRGVIFRPLKEVGSCFGFSSSPLSSIEDLMALWVTHHPWPSVLFLKEWIGNTCSFYSPKVLRWVSIGLCLLSLGGSFFQCVQIFQQERNHKKGEERISRLSQGEALPKDTEDIFTPLKLMIEDYQKVSLHSPLDFVALLTKILGPGVRILSWEWEENGGDPLLCLEVQGREREKEEKKGGMGEEWLKEIRLAFHPARVWVEEKKKRVSKRTGGDPALQKGEEILSFLLKIQGIPSSL